MGNSYIIGIDAGTSMVKSIVFGKGGEELAVSSRKVELIIPSQGRVEQNMDEVWDSVAETIREVLTMTAIDPNDVAAVAVTAEGDGLWMIGYDGNPAGNAINWMDSRGSDLCVRWYTDGTATKIYGVNGFPMYPGNYLCLVRWVIENDPELLENTAWLADCKDWLKFKMTGKVSRDESMALLHDIATTEFEPAMIEICGFESVKDKFPETLGCLENHAPLTEDMAVKLGLPAGIPVFGGPFDVIACAVGAGVLGEGDASVTIGTTTMVALGQNSPYVDSISPTLNNGFPNSWLRVQGVMTGTPNIEWAIKNLGMKYEESAKLNNCSIYEEIERHISTVNPGCDGVMYHPYLSPSGERSPFVKPSAKAQFFGISTEHTTDHLFRAVYEGIGFSVMNCIDLSQATLKSLRLIGGGSKSPFLCQLMADMTGLEILVVDGEQVGARGSSIVASVALNLYPSAEEARNQCIEIKGRYTPNPELVEKYQKLYKLYVAVYKSLWDTWDLRAEILQGL